MKEGSDGLPAIGSSTRTLGVRPGIDIPAQNPSDIVWPGQGGMSVNPDAPVYLPDFRRPPEFGGTGSDPVWNIRHDNLGPDLIYRPDPTKPGMHGFIEPGHPMALQAYQNALGDTQNRWNKL
jgi:hypothetical protein